MKNKKKVVIDTTSLISLYSNVFGVPSKISNKTLQLIRDGLENSDKMIIFIPNIVFIEIFDKWFRFDNPNVDEFKAKFIAEIYKPLKNAENVEFREMDREILDVFLDIKEDTIKLENHDRLVLATALTLKADIVTSDEQIKKFLLKKKLVKFLE